MTRNDIVRMADEAGLDSAWIEDCPGEFAALERFADLAIAADSTEFRRLQSATCKDCSLSHMAERIAQLQAEVTALRIYAPAKRAGAMQPPVQIAPTNFAYWVNETGEEFKAWGNAHTEVAG